MKKKLLSFLATGLVIASANPHSYALNPLTRFRNWIHGYSTIEKSARKVLNVSKIATDAKQKLKKYYQGYLRSNPKRDFSKVSHRVSDIPSAADSTMYRIMRGNTDWCPVYIGKTDKNVCVGFAMPSDHPEEIINQSAALIEYTLMNHFDLDVKLDYSKNGYERFKPLCEKLVSSKDALNQADIKFLNACKLLKTLESKLATVEKDFRDGKYMLLIIEGRSQAPNELSQFYIEVMERRTTAL